MHSTLFSLALVAAAICFTSHAATGQEQSDDAAHQPQRDQPTREAAPPDPTRTEEGGNSDVANRSQDSSPGAENEFNGEQYHEGRQDRDRAAYPRSDRREESEMRSEGSQSRERTSDRIQSAADLNVQFNSVDNGLELTQVNRNSILADAGFQRGDVLLAADGRTLRNEADFIRWYRTVPSGTPVPVAVLRDGQHQTIYFSASADRYRGYDRRSDYGNAAYLGVVFDDRYPNLAIVEVVRRNTAAHAAGLRPGDTIQSINGQRVRGMQHVAQLISNLQPGAEIDVVYARRARATARLGARPSDEQMAYDDYDTDGPRRVEARRVDSYQSNAEQREYDDGRSDRRDDDGFWEEGPARRAISRPFRTPE